MIEDIPKTLNDIGNKNQESLKEEAIKWYKDIEHEQPYLELNGPKAVQQWIKAFFGLKDEDFRNLED